ncbi:MAG TPA: ferric reductase-like transmembrane domain-containing protein [Ktedonobacterales bacterium]
MGTHRRASILLAFLLALIGVAGLLAAQPAVASAAGATPQAANNHITYKAQLSGQADDSYLGTDDQGYTIHYLTITATLTPQDSHNPPLQVRLYVSEAFYPNVSTQEQQDVIPGGGQVVAAGVLRGSASVSNAGGTIPLYVANVSGLVLGDSSMHFDVEGAGTGKASGGKTSLYLTINPTTGQDLSGQVTGTLDIPQAALDLITSNDPLAGPTFWYFLRASGLAALALLAATVLIGLALRVRFWKATLERWRVYDVHLTVSILTAIFLALHLMLVFMDRIVPFSLTDMLVPLHDSYQPIWVAAGIIGVYLLLVVWGSSLIRNKISYSLWRSLHPLALGALGLAMLHALFAGTDGPTLWLRTMLVLITLAVIWLFDRWMRLKTVENEQRIRRGGGSRRQPPRRQAAPQPYRQPPSYAPTPRQAPPQAGPRPTPGTQPRPRRVSQE